VARASRSPLLSFYRTLRTQSGSYLSQNDTRLHFGLGSETKMTKVEIRWPNGKTEELKDVAADAIYTVVEGSGITQTTPLPKPAAAN
jgi:hypothetical protein